MSEVRGQKSETKVAAMSHPEDMNFSCSLPNSRFDSIQMAHGSGGKLMHQLVDEVFTSVLSRRSVYKSPDAAVVNFPSGRLAFTTDSYVVNPIVFPGGDIGKLAVNGTINDLAMS